MRCSPCEHTRLSNGLLDDVWRRNIKPKIFKTTDEPIFVYGRESWSVTKTLVKTFDRSYN